MLDRNSWTAAFSNIGNIKKEGYDASNYAAVKITPNTNFNPEFNAPGQIIGVLSEPLNLSFDSTWTNMDSIDVPYVGDVANLVLGEITNLGNSYSMYGGGGELGATWKNTQVWQKSGYVKLNIKMDVVDWNGTGTPLVAAQNLIRMCTPNVDTTNKSLGNVKAAYELGSGKIKKYLTDGGGTGVASDDNSTMSRRAANNMLNVAPEFLTLKAGPVPVTIEIGQYFKHDDMVIKNVSTTFSKEVTAMGPISVSIDLQCESRKIINGEGNDKYSDTGILPFKTGAESLRVQFAPVTP
jgi:hypothetical protein